jgi:hypothetical protein
LPVFGKAPLSPGLRKGYEAVALDAAALQGEHALGAVVENEVAWAADLHE